LILRLYETEKFTMDQLPPLQQILDTDKRNPVFTIYRDANEQILHVYYGGRLLDKVPDDKGDPEYKLLLARLFNAGGQSQGIGGCIWCRPQDHETLGIGP